MFSLPRRNRLAALALPIALALAVAACETIRVNPVPDQPPTVTLTSGPIDTVSAPQSWLVDIAWVATDPDGQIDHVEYAIDPPHLKQAMAAHAETAWVQTHENHVVARFHASHPDSMGPGATASEFHVFVLRAVDDRGVRSPNVVRAFYAYTVAPDVRITRPIPSIFFSPSVPVPFRMDWVGNDPDGADGGRPVAYRMRLLNLNDYGNVAYLADPDSLLREGAADGWAGWSAVAGDSTSHVITTQEIGPGQTGLLALVAVDEAGATTAYLDFNRNFLQFTAAPPGSTGPRVHIFSPLVDFTYASGGYSLDPLREIVVEAPAHQLLAFHWDGVPTPGRQLVSVRWKLDDGVWSTPSPPPGTAQFTLDPGTHRLYVELTDDFNETSLGIVRISAIDVTLQSELLVVNDTRLEVDKFTTGGAPTSYTQPWPSRAELDTFLFARGGYPWRGTKNPPSGVLSTPGLLAGYPFDTLGTRLGLENAADGVPLRVLAQYRHVIWLVDQRGSLFSASVDQGIFPVTALRAMSRPGVASALAAYIQMGGRVWLAGGGTAFASLAEFDRRSNNQGQITVFTVDDGELGPGRPLYDAAHVRSAIGVTKSDLSMNRSAAAIGGWSGHGPDGTLSAPDYSHAPAAMRRRDPGTDPLPPTRLASQAALYYPTTFPAGFVMEPDTIREDFGTPGVPRVESALDTVYDVSGAVLPIPSAPVMLYYHGRDNVPFVYTGFEPWDYTRDDCQGLVDFVLHDIWGLAKSAPGVRPGAAPLHVQRPATSRVSARLDPHRMRP